jgi:predicted ATP-dependent endonuclease of OLD family
MRLARARVQNYRSIKDTGWFEVEPGKTILVGANEAGKTALMRVLEHLRPGPLVKPLVPLRDFPRSELQQIQRSTLDPKDVVVVEAEYELDDADRASIRELSPHFADCRYWFSKTLDNQSHHSLRNEPERPTVGQYKDEFRRLAAHADARVAVPPKGVAPPKPSETLNSILGGVPGRSFISVPQATDLEEWLDATAAHVDGTDDIETQRLAALRNLVALVVTRDEILELLSDRQPTMVYYSTYTRVQPSIHLRHFADTLDAGAIDPADAYNFGNSCLLQLLGFSARELSDLGNVPEPGVNDAEGMQRLKDQLDDRSYRLNAASIELTDKISEVWQPSGVEAANGAASDSDYTVRIVADQQYLKVVVEDSLGANVELDQRSEGFQWLVSFFIVFFAQATETHVNAILLLDEPGLSLHGLKQREFRRTLSKLAESNQLLFTTHSPFLVGPDELDIVRVVEMVDRTVGTIVHSDVIADDPASLLPLQEALGYDIAQSLFAQHRNLVLESLTDYWYVEAVSELFRDAGLTELNHEIALFPASSTGKVVYFATILHAHHLKVAALLDSDAAGDTAANQEVLVRKLGQKGILRTKDAYAGLVAEPEIEELLRDTLVEVGKSECGWDVSEAASSQPTRGIVDIFAAEIGSDFSKFRLAKGFLRWSRIHAAPDLTDYERLQWATLIQAINQALG